MKEIIVAPSVLSADFLNLESDLNKMKENNIDWIHYDVMDNWFVPNLSFGPDILAQINKKFNFKIDAHLMVMTNRDIEEYLLPYVKAGVAQITIHFEAFYPNLINKFVNFCRKNNVIPSLAIKPSTQVIDIKDYLHLLGNVLVMSVEPGFGGQKFMIEAVKKVKELNEIRIKDRLEYRIEIDGGINEDTIKYLYNSGIDMVVAGSYLFGHEDLKERIKAIKYVE